MKSIVYYSSHCTESMEAKKVLEEAGLAPKMEWVDVTSGMDPLRRFLKLRDEHEFFQDARKNDRVGVPTLVFGDNEILMDVEDGVPVEKVRELLEK
ncbi:MAG: glutaredoxin [Tissierellia bacterium]|nr:glutaredoxin [Tissierellia bacterium]